MEITNRRCAYCEKLYQPDPRTAKFQKACSQNDCQLARQRQKYRRWIKLNPGYESSRRAKIRAWAQAYPDYWQRYRKTHLEYVQRDNQRRRKAHKQEKSAAKQTAISEIAVEKLRDIQAEDVKSAAKQTAIVRRVDEVIEFLIWKESAAKQKPIGATAWAVP